MSARFATAPLKKALLPLLLAGTTLLGGCYYPGYYGYGYGPGYGYAAAYPAYVAPPVVGGVFIGGGGWWGRRYWR